MTNTEAARFLIDKLPKIIENVADDKLRNKLSAVANRIALLVFSVPSLQAFITDYAVIPSKKNDGSVIIQLDFLELPKKIIPDLEKLLSLDYFKNHRLVRFIKNGQSHTGIEIEVTPKDLNYDDYSYTF